MVEIPGSVCYSYLNLIDVILILSEYYNTRKANDD